MIALMSQTKLPDSSNPLSDIVGAVQGGSGTSIMHTNLDEKNALLLGCVDNYRKWIIVAAK